MQRVHLVQGNVNLAIIITYCYFGSLFFETIKDFQYLLEINIDAVYIPMSALNTEYQQLKDLHLDTAGIKAPKQIFFSVF